MFHPRKINKFRLINGLKVYSIIKDGKELESDIFLEHLEEVWEQVFEDVEDPIGFAIFHEGTEKYLVIFKWGNENELIPFVSVRKDGEWVQDISKHSFCLWDLEIFWKERNSYIKHVYSDSPHIGDYRKDFVAESADFVNASD